MAIMNRVVMILDFFKILNDQKEDHEKDNAWYD